MRLAQRRDIYVLAVAGVLAALLLLFRDPIHHGFSDLAGRLLARADRTSDVDIILSYMEAGPAVGESALELEGYDPDGNLIRLADQRGKVVFLYFYAHGCSPCRAMYPRERSLALEHYNDPFVMIGVNVGEEPDEIRRIAEQEKLTWPIIVDVGGNRSRGPIAARWDVMFIPTTYVIDHKGIVRYKNVRGDKLNRAIGELVDRAGE